jgi:alpha,alpha-trehalase
LQYNVTELGAIGSGGEYQVQKGFGWTNGVVLDLLAKYGDRLTAPQPPYTESLSSGAGVPGPSILLPLAMLLTIPVFLSTWLCDERHQHRA